VLFYFIRFTVNIFLTGRCSAQTLRGEKGKPARRSLKEIKDVSDFETAKNNFI